MNTVRPLPETGSILLDTRGEQRALRISWHDQDGLVILSLWRDDLCQGTFRLAVEEVPVLIEVLRSGLVRGEEGIDRAATA